MAEPGSLTRSEPSRSEPPKSEPAPSEPAPSEPGRSGPVNPVERILFASRWLLAPLYVGLVVALGLLVVKFAQHAWHLGETALTMTDTEATVGILQLIDLSLLSNLVLLVMFAGYEGFVSRIEVGSDQQRLAWMGRVSFGDLKLKLLASVVAISAIRLLEEVLNVDQVTDRELSWLVGVNLTFVGAGLLLALTDRMGGDH